MDRQLTVSVRGLVVAGAVLLALVVAYVLGQAGGGVTAQAAAADEGTTDARTLTMRGVGKVTAVPDEVGFDVTVQVTRPDISTALGDTNDLLDGVLTTLDGLGVGEDDIETTGIRMNPQYRYIDRKRVFRGYHVEQSVAVLVTDVDSAGEAISRVVESGGNAVRVGDIRLQIGDPEAALADARQRAVAAATDKAQEYADATGQGLGDVRTLVEVSPQDVQSQVSSERAAYALDAMSAVSPVSISAGRSEVSVTVQIVWTLAD